MISGPYSSKEFKTSVIILKSESTMLGIISDAPSNIDDHIPTKALDSFEASVGNMSIMPVNISSRLLRALDTVSPLNSPKAANAATMSQMEPATVAQDSPSIRMEPLKDNIEGIKGVKSLATPPNATKATTTEPRAIPTVTGSRSFRDC